MTKQEIEIVVELQKKIEEITITLNKTYTSEYKQTISIGTDRFISSTNKYYDSCISKITEALNNERTELQAELDTYKLFKQINNG